MGPTDNFSLVTGPAATVKKISNKYYVTTYEIKLIKSRSISKSSVTLEEGMRLLQTIYMFVLS